MGGVIPVALTSTLLLHALGVSINVAMFGEVTRETILRDGRTISESTVVTIVAFVGTSHWQKVSPMLRGKARNDLLVE